MTKEQIEQQELVWVSQGDQKVFNKNVLKQCKKMLHLSKLQIMEDEVDFQTPLNKRSYRDRMIILAKFGYGATYPEIGAVYGITCVRARQVAMKYVEEIYDVLVDKLPEEWGIGDMPKWYLVSAR